jgi:excisionase family DNA binding protein
MSADFANSLILAPSATLTADSVDKIDLYSQTLGISKTAFLSPAQTALVLNVSRETVYRMIRAGQLPNAKCQGREGGGVASKETCGAAHSTTVRFLSP